MITKIIFTVLSFIPLALLDGMSALSIDLGIPPEVAQGLGHLTSALFYVFPVSALMPLFYASLSIKGFQITWAIVLRIKSFIPTMGA